MCVWLIMGFFVRKEVCVCALRGGSGRQIESSLLERGTMRPQPHCYLPFFFFCSFRWFSFPFTPPLLFPSPFKTLDVLSCSSLYISDFLPVDSNPYNRSIHLKIYTFLSFLQPLSSLFCVRLFRLTSHLPKRLPRFSFVRPSSRRHILHCHTRGHGCFFAHACFVPWAAFSSRRHPRRLKHSPRSARRILSCAGKEGSGFSFSVFP